MNTFQRIGWFLLFLTSGLLVFLVFSHYYPFYKGNIDKTGRIMVAVIFLGLALFARKDERFQKYWLIPFAFFAALTAVSIDYSLSYGRWILPGLGIPSESPVGWAVGKLESSLLDIPIAAGDFLRTVKS